MPNNAADLTERFWAHVTRCAHGDPCLLCCWEWQGRLVRGYGSIFVPKALRHGRSKEERANRVCWRLVHGDIPAGLHVLHHCDNPRCVNPAHLWLGTIDANQKDSMRKGRRPTGDNHGLRIHPESRRRGEANPRAILTREQVYAIREYGRLGYPQWQIAEGLGITAGTVGNVLRHVSWDHLPAREETAFVNRLGPIRHTRVEGEANPNARVTAEQVRAIRAARASGLTYRAIAEHYQVSPSLIGLIVTGKIWQYREEQSS